MTKFDELSRDEQFYVRTRADALGVRVEYLDVDEIMEHYKPPDSWFDRLRNANEAVATYNRERAEKAGPLPVALPTEAERRDFAKRLNVRPEHVRTAEQVAAEELAERQRQEYETAANSKSTYDLVEIGRNRDHPHWEDARRKVAEYFPSFDSWV